MKPIRCLELSMRGARAVLIDPEHPEYEELRSREDEAYILLDRWRFKDRAVRTFLQMLLAQLTGAA